MEDEEIDRSPSIGLFLSGESYFLSAQYLRKGQESNSLRLRFDMPVYYLYSHALELILKGFLRSKGVSIGQLRSRKFGHSLQALWSASIEKGFSGHPIKLAYIEQAIELLEPSALEFEFRYIKVGLKSRPTLEAVEQAVSDLMGLVRPHCEATVNGSISDPHKAASPP
jgi:hypothetical protein